MDYPDYDPRIDSPPLADAELEALDTLLQALPADNPMNVEAMDGFLTALLVGPPGLAGLRSAAWLPQVWGGDGDGSAPFASQKQRKRVALLVLRHLHAIDRALRTAPDAWEPVFSIAEHDKGEWVDAEDWCVGFLHAVSLAPAAWEALFDDAALAPIVLLGGDDSEVGEADLLRLADPEERDRLSRAVVDAVLSLNARRVEAG